jgi:hypothetical protein
VEKEQRDPAGIGRKDSESCREKFSKEGWAWVRLGIMDSDKSDDVRLGYQSRSGVARRAEADRAEDDDGRRDDDQIEYCPAV